MSTMLFNTTHTEELRVVVINKNQLQDLLLEQPGKEQKKANIYMGRITRIEPSLEAAFVDYGQERHGFLPLKEIAPYYYPSHIDPNSHANIKDVLKEGQEILIQVDKEERGNKGAALSSVISLAGSYLVLMPNNPRAGGISRRIEGENRTELKETLNQLQIPEGMGVIIRTAGIGKSVEDLQWDLNYLIALWEAIQKACASGTVPFLVYQESDIIFRAIRDYLRPEIDEIIVDNEETYHKIRKHISWLHPEFVSHVNLYTSNIPLFVRYQVESQIDLVFQREISLPSGGSIIIDRTEALISIDINSARSTRGIDIEETALNTNLEAADEIARQLRLRDLGGLIVIDFIDMTPIRHQRAVEDRLSQVLSHDRARIQIGRISRFGLLEMSRQRLRSSVGETTQEVCPRCHGRGAIRSVESLTISVMRLIEEYAVKEHAHKIYVQVPVEVASYLLNEKRTDISVLEKLHNIVIFVMPNPHMETPAVEISSIKASDQKSQLPSHKLITKPEEKDLTSTLRKSEDEVKDTSAVKDFIPEQPAPQTVVSKPKVGFLTKLIKQFFSARPEKQTPPQKQSRPHHTNRQDYRQDRNDRSKRDRQRGGAPRRNRQQSNQNRRQQTGGSRHDSSRYEGSRDRDQNRNRNRRDFDQKHHRDRDHSSNQHETVPSSIEQEKRFVEIPNPITQQAIPKHKQPESVVQTPNISEQSSYPVKQYGNKENNCLYQQEKTSHKA